MTTTREHMVQNAQAVVKAVGDAAVAVGEWTWDFAKRHPILTGVVVGSQVLGALAQMKERYVNANTVLEIDFEKYVITHASVTPLAATLSKGKLITTTSLCAALYQAADDPKVIGLLAHVAFSQRMPLATIQELREAVAYFKSKGKKTIAYSETFGEAAPGQNTYYFASVFDRIYLAKSGDVNIIDFSVEQPFVKHTLDKIGVVPHIMARKQYKNMPNMFMCDKFTDAHRENLDTIMSDLRTMWICDVAAGRKLEEKAVAAALSEGPFSAQDALTRKLIDGIAYRDEIYSKLSEHFGPTPTTKVNLLFLTRYLNKRGFEEWNGGRDVIAYINCIGTIHRGDSTTDYTGVETDIGSNTVCHAMRNAVASPKVKAIVLHVNSGGGSYVASDQIAREVLNAKRAGKKVVVCMSDVAASGGYFIAHFADRIVAQPGTITGSIGVFSGKFITAGLMEKIGVTWDRLVYGDNALLNSALVDYSESDEKRMNEFLDRVYADFTGQVAEGRGLAKDAVDGLAGGRVWTGQQAKKHKLVDQHGGIIAAVRVAKQLAGIDEKAPVRLRAYPPKLGFLDGLFARPTENSNDFGDNVSIGSPLPGSLALPYRLAGALLSTSQFYTPAAHSPAQQLAARFAEQLAVLLPTPAANASAGWLHGGELPSTLSPGTCSTYPPLQTHGPGAVAAAQATTSM